MGYGINDKEIFVSSVRATFKRFLPVPLRKLLRACLHYTQRNLRWFVVLWQVRGATLRDQMILLLSACMAPVMSLRELHRWQDPVLLSDATVDVAGIGKFSLRAHTDDLWHVLPWREQSIANAMRSMLSSGDVFIDAGANIGIYTVLASRLVGPTGQVICIEMMPDTADRLESHIRMNGLQNVKVFRRALSDVSGQMVRASVQEGKYGQATIATDSERFGLGHVIDVETITLDEITRDIECVRLMKIDVEGAELSALRGATQLLQRLYALIYESWGCKRGILEPVDRLLEGAGYSTRQLDGNNWIATRQVEK